ncbi:MAG: DNA-processing protein DprA [Rickettsiales bacterium]|jgi:DNA processing protein|nr:DNA-processing protein DprA [Rickettsiales bacterium]
MIENIDDLCRKKVSLCSDERIQEELEAHKKLGAKILTYRDDEYPRYLKAVPTFPLALSCIGNVDLLNAERKVTVVGSRNCSVNTFNFAKKISREISSYGYIVVSGLARGVDSAAHIGSLENKTIAVLGSGLENIYPKENNYLYHEILNNDGLVISEFRLKANPEPENFPIRNKTMAGISRGVLIVGAGLLSGSLNTANQAIKYGREILVFPGNPYDSHYMGSNKLLQQGATMVLDTRDIIENLESYRLPVDIDMLTVGPRPEPEFFEKNTPSVGSPKKNKSVHNTRDVTDERNRTLTAEEFVLSKLDHCPIDVGQLFDSLDLDIGEINSILVKLNLEGKIDIGSGKVCLVEK